MAGRLDGCSLRLLSCHIAILPSVRDPPYYSYQAGAGRLSVVGPANQAVQKGLGLCKLN